MSTLQEYLDKSDYQRDIIRYHATISQLFANQEINKWNNEQLKELSDLLKPAFECYIKHHKPATECKKDRKKEEDENWWRRS